MSPLVDAHSAAGEYLTVAGLRTFVRDHGDGAPVLCIHGVPVSSYVYRKLLPELNQRGLRAIAFDLPGMGLTDRPESFDYTWTGLGRFVAELVDVLSLERFHLLVHDIGGPVGFELLSHVADRVESLTILNTFVRVEGFTKPWTMRPFEVPWVGEAWLGSMVAPVFTALMYRIGISDRTIAPPAEVAIHLELLKHVDRGRAFLKIMRCFETTGAKQRQYLETLGEASFPMQAIWGKDDPALRVDVHGAHVRAIVGDEAFHAVDGLHFVQETQAPFIAERVAAIAS